MGRVTLRRMDLGADYRLSSLVQPSPQQLETIGMSINDIHDQHPSLPNNTVVSPDLIQFQIDGKKLILDTIASLQEDSNRDYAVELSLGDPAPTQEEYAAMLKMASAIQRTLTSDEEEDIDTPPLDPDYHTGLYL